MTYGIIDRKCHESYTLMSIVFSGINDAQKDYNWLITDCEVCSKNIENEELFSREYCWLTGEELSRIIEEEDFQWIWGVLSGFEKDIPLEEVLKYPLPDAVDYNGYYKNPLSLQHPLSTIEIVPCDSSRTLILSKDKKVIDDYIEHYPKVQDLTLENQE